MSSGKLAWALDAVALAAAFVPGVGWAIRAGIILVSQAGSAYLRRRNLSQRQEGIAQNVTSSQVALPVIYGRTKVGLAVVDVRVDTTSENNERLAVVGAIAVGSENGGGIEDVESIYFDERLAILDPVFEGEPSTVGVMPAWIVDEVAKLEYGLHAGADDQVVDAELDTKFGAWGSSGAGKGIAHLVLWLRYDEDVYPTGIPNVTAILKGQKVYDPREETWGWSDNPALCVLDYLTSKRYGLGAAYAARDGGSLDEIDEDSFIAAANYCDETVSTPAGNQTRYTCNGWVDTGQPLMRNLAELLTSCRGQLIHEGGRFRLQINAPALPTTFELTEDNIVGDWEFFRAGMSQAPNKVVATFVDADAAWQPNDVAWPEASQSNGFLTNDAGFDNVLSIDLPFTNEYYRALQLGMVTLREAREDVGVVVTAKESALVLQVGQVVPLTHSTPGWTEKLMRVRAMGITQAGLVRLVLTEYDDDAYDLDALNTRDTMPGTDLPDPFTVEPPTDVTVQSNQLTAQGLVPRLLVTWTRSAHAFLAGYEVEYRPVEESEAEWLPAGAPGRDLTSMLIGPVQDRKLYDVRIRAKNTIGRTSEWVQVDDVMATIEPRAIARLDLDGNDLYLVWDALNPYGVDRFQYLVDDEDAPTEEETEASGDFESTGRGLIHSFDPTGPRRQKVWVGLIPQSPEPPGGGDRANGTFEVIPESWGADANRPKIALEYVGRGSGGKEKWQAVGTDNGDAVAVNLRVFAADADPVPDFTRYPAEGFASDPHVVPFEFTHPAYGDPDVIIQAYTEDEDGEVSDVDTRVSDWDTLPTGTLTLDVDPVDNEAYYRVDRKDTDSKSYRVRFKKGEEALPAFAASDFEVAGTNFGERVKVSSVCPGIEPVKDTEVLYGAGYTLNTTSTTAATQEAAERSEPIRANTSPAERKNIIKSAWLETSVRVSGGISWLETDLHYQVGDGVVSLLIVVTDGTTPNTTRVNLSGTEGRATGVYSFTNPPLTGTVTPYNAADADLGSGVVGPSFDVEEVVPPGAAKVKYGDSSFTGQQINLPATGYLAAASDSDGNPKVTLRFTKGTGAPGTLGVGEMYGRHA